MPAFMAISLALCMTAVAADYVTTFATPEDPLSEGMVWQHATNIWKHVRIVGDGSAANPHRAVGHDNRAYDDAYAQLAGFAPDQLAEATIWIDPTIPAHEIHEVELHLRWADSPGRAGTQESARGYELLLAYDGAYYAIVRWDGPYGRFTRLAVGYHLSPVPKTGDTSGGRSSVPLFASIPRSRDDPELRWVYDTEVVGDLIAVSAPVPGHVVAQEVQHCAAEVREGAVALVVGGMSVHQPP